MIGQTLVKYGGLTLFNVLTRSLNQELVRDDSDSDPIGFRFTYSCVGHIHGMPASTVGVIPTTGDFNAANNTVAIRYLFADRQHFELRMGVTVDGFGNIVNPGTALLVCDPANIAGNTNVNLRDINNGPKAKVLNITHVVADSIFTVEVEFEIMMLNCFPDGTTANASGVLNNRWTVVDDIDRNFTTTRTFTGKLRLSSAQVNPHSFRGWVVPPLQQGMRREHMQFAASEDGLALMYSVTDREVHFAPPAPATSWSARFEEEIAIDGQLGFFSTADITLRGDRYADHKQLIAIANAMALAKFSNGVRLADDDRFFVQSISVVDEYSDDESSVHLRATARRTDISEAAMNGLPTKYLGVPLAGNKLGNWLSSLSSYDYTLSRGARPGDSLEVNGPISVAAAFSVYLQGPCDGNHFTANGLLVVPQPPNPAKPTTSVSVVKNSDIPDDGTITTVYGTANNDGAYTYSESQVEEHTDTNRIPAPVAKTPQGSQSPGSPGNPPQFSLGDALWNGRPPPTDPSNPDVKGVTVGPPVTKREQVTDAERIGKPPDVPVPKDHVDGAGRKWRLWSSHVITKSPRFTSDGKKIFRKQLRIRWWAETANIISSAAGSTIVNWVPFAANPEDTTQVPPAIDTKGP